MAVALEYPTMVTCTSILRIGFDDPFKPLAWAGLNGPEGPLVDIVARVVDAAGFKVDFVPLALQDSLAVLAGGGVDALAYKAVVPDRGPELLFTAPLAITGAALFLLASTGEPWGSERSPRVLATPAKGPLVDILAKRFPQARRILTEDYPGALKAVVAGAADGAALNVHAGWHWAEALYPKQFVRPNDLIEKLPLAMVVDKGRSAGLRDQFNVSIRKLRDSGELAAIAQRSGIEVPD